MSTLRRYRSGFMWGALASWHRPQGDPLGHLGNERRGCLSLPDADCCYLPVWSLTAPAILMLAARVHICVQSYIALADVWSNQIDNDGVCGSQAAGSSAPGTLSKCCQHKAPQMLGKLE